MYQDFYKLKQLPFQLLPDPDFFFHSHKHDNALTHLEYGISQRAGFIVITGEIGTGKTTLLRYMLRSLDEDLPLAMISQTFLKPEELLQALCLEFSIPCHNKGKLELLELFGTFLVEQYRKGKYVILILDEAQNLPLETLEEIRMLSNLDADDECLLQIILVGQPALREKLQSKELRQLFQRVEVSYHLTPLDKEELKEYIHYRIKTAGGQDEALFDDKAIEAIYDYSGGVPRLINAVCHNCLVYGFADDKKKINHDLVEAVLNDRAEYGLFPPSGTVEKQEISLRSSSNRAMNQEATSVKNELNNKLDHLIKISGYSTGAFERLVANRTDRPNQTIVTDLKKSLGNEQRSRKALENRLSQVETTLSQAKTDTSRMDPEKPLPAKLDDEPQLPMRGIVNVAAEKGKHRFDENLSNLKKPGLLPFFKRRMRFAMISVLFIICILAVVWAGMWFSEDDDSNKGKPETAGVESVISSETTALPENKDTKAEKNKMEADRSEPVTQPHVATPYDLAKKALEKKDFKKAIELLESSSSSKSYDPIVLNKLHAMALTGQVKSMLADKRLTEAEATLLKAVALNPDNFETHFELGKLYTKTKAYQKAVNSYQRATELDPEMASAFYNLGFVFAKNSHYDSAEEALLSAAELNPPYNDKVLFNLAVVQLKLGKKEICIQNLRKSLTLNPDNRRAEAFLEKLVNNPGEEQ